MGESPHDGKGDQTVSNTSTCHVVHEESFYSERFLITVHRDDAPAFALLRDRYQKRKAPIEGPALLLYRIIDALVDSFFPILADFDDRGRYHRASWHDDRSRASLP
jgi:Mg2+ and Co2+ transporter CorA